MKKTFTSNEYKLTCFCCFSYYIWYFCLIKNLTECIQMLDKNLKTEDKDYIKTLTEDEFFMESHFTLGMGIRNEWIRSGNPELVTFFLDQGVKHPDDMSAMILTSYYRYLTNSNN